MRLIGTEIMDPIVGVYAADRELHNRNWGDTGGRYILLVVKSRLGWTIINGL
jgi:hypothetical protein